MNKPLFVISSPFDTYSGYGARSRDLIKSIIKSEKYEVKLLSQRWGNTPFGFINDHIEEWGFLRKHLLDVNKQNPQPDVWMQITIPSEFQPFGKYNIGVTAGMETTLVDGSWVEGMNRMDLNLVSSEHSKQSFLNSIYEKRDQQGNNLGQISLDKPVEVLFEGANLDVYKHIEKENYTNTLEKLDSIKENFCFLFVGHWMGGILGEDRKNVGTLIKAFFEMFKNNPSAPALILKTSGAGSSYTDREVILDRINQIKATVKGKLPNIYLLHGELSDEEMNTLYNHPKVKSMISLTKGEGFGRPLLEFSLVKKPIIASAWSGHMDFLKPEFNALIGGELRNVHPSAVVPNMILAESQWFSPNPMEIGKAISEVFYNYKKYSESAKRQAYFSKSNFSWKKMDEKLNEYLDKFIPKFASEVKLKLPKLNKIQLPKKEIING
jgi:glycosyltransferase involved in cell wall biosynthesis